MTKSTNKTIRVSFQEKKPSGFIDRSFDTCREHLGWHLSQMKKSPDNIRDVSYRNI